MKGPGRTGHHHFFDLIADLYLDTWRSCRPTPPVFWLYVRKHRGCGTLATAFFSLLHLDAWPSEYLSTALVAMATTLIPFHHTSNFSNFVKTFVLPRGIFSKSLTTVKGMLCRRHCLSVPYPCLVISSMRLSKVKRLSCTNVYLGGTSACSARPRTTLGPCAKPVSGRCVWTPQ